MQKSVEIRPHVHYRNLVNDMSQNEVGPFGPLHFASIRHYTPFLLEGAAKRRYTYQIKLRHHSFVLVTPASHVVFVWLLLKET